MKQILLYTFLVLPFFSDSQDHHRLHWKRQVSKHGLAFKVSIPEGNFLRLNKGTTYGNEFGFLGISVGAEYYYSNRHNINFDIGALTDFLLPFPAPVDYMGIYDRASALYADLQVGTDFGRFHSDAGIQFTRTSYVEREKVEIFPNYIDTLKYSKRQYNAGLAFSTYYRITRSFNAGINYYPSFLAFDDGKIKARYGHLLFVELLFRIRTRQR